MLKQPSKHGQQLELDDAREDVSDEHDQSVVERWEKMPAATAGTTALPAMVIAAVRGTSAK